MSNTEGRSPPGLSLQGQWPKNAQQCSLEHAVAALGERVADALGQVVCELQEIEQHLLALRQQVVAMQLAGKRSRAHFDTCFDELRRHLRSSR